MGVIQAITEFLPVSSSGHLFFASSIMQLNFSLLLLMYLHFATLIAIVIFFRKDIVKYLLNKKIISLVALTTVTTLIIAKFITDIEFLLQNKYIVSIAFLSSGIMLLTTKKHSGSRDISVLDWRDFFFLGVIQGVAIIPGLSRSGATISLLLNRKIKKNDAFKISFLALIPTIIIALIYQTRFQLQSTHVDFNFYAISFFSALIFGVFALKLLNKFVKKNKLHLFSYYCFLMSLLTLLVTR